MEGFCHSIHKYFSLKERAITSTCDRLLWLSWLVNEVLCVLLLSSHFVHLGQPPWTKSVEIWCLVIRHWGMCPDSHTIYMKLCDGKRRQGKCICSSATFTILFVCISFLFVLTQIVQKGKSSDVVANRWIGKWHFYRDSILKKSFPNPVEQILAGKRNFWQRIGISGGITSEDISLIENASSYPFKLFCCFYHSCVKQALSCPEYCRLRGFLFSPWRSQARWWTCIKSRDSTTR